MEILPANQAPLFDFAKFNGGPHLCVEVPDGHFTITARTSEGKKITFAFCPYQDNGPPQCVDVQHHTSPKSVLNGSIVCPVQKIICFTPGHNTFASNLNDTIPTTLVTVILKDK